MNVPSVCTAGNIGWALPMNIASMWGFSLENGGVSKSGVRRVYGPSMRGVLSSATRGCTVFGHEGLCRLVQSGLGLRVCGAVEGDELTF